MTMLQSEPPSPNRNGALSPHMKELAKDVDWDAALPLPESVRADERESPWLALSSIVPGLFLTSQRAAEDKERLMVLGFKLVIKMNADCDEAPFSVHEWDEDACGIVHRALDERTFVNRLVQECSTLNEERAILMEPVFVRAVAADDSPVYDIAAFFEEMSCLIEVVLSRRKRLEEAYVVATANGENVRLPNVVVHCMAGVSRAASIVLAYLMKRYHISRARALEYVQAARPIASPNSGFSAQLTLWESNRGHRVTDDATACVVAENILRDNSRVQIAQLLCDQLRVLTSSPRVADDRETFGRLVGHLVRAGAGKVDAATVVHCLDKVLREGIEDQVYIDCPKFVQHVAEVTASIKKYSHWIMATMEWSQDETDDAAASSGHSDVAVEAAEDSNCASERQDAKKAMAPRPAFVFDDAIHERFLRAFYSQASDAGEAAEAMTKYLHALGTTQLVVGMMRRASKDDDVWLVEPSCAARPVALPLGRGPHSEADDTALPVSGTAQYPTGCIRRVSCHTPMAVSFPCLPLIAEYACGYVPWSTIDVAVPSYVETVADAVSAFQTLQSLVHRWFLVARWDGAVAAVGTDNLQRWASCTTDPNGLSYLHFLKDDAEVLVLERLEAMEATMLAVASPDAASSAHETLLAAVMEQVIKPTWRQCIASCDARAIQHLSTNDGDEAHSSDAFNTAVLGKLGEKVVAGVEGFLQLQRTSLDYVLRTTTVRHHNAPLDEASLLTHPWSAWLEARRLEIVAATRSVVATTNAIV